MNIIEYIEDNTVSLEVSHRGGGIEIDATAYLGDDYPLKMTAYQNYLGGDMLGAVQSSVEGILHEYPEEIQNKALELSEHLKRYFHDLTNSSHDHWSSSSYESNQLRPESGY